MKKLRAIFFITLLSLSVAAQKSADYGIYGGVSSYLGDINTSRLFYSPLPAGGLFYRYNLHPRQSLRANVLIGGLQARDLDFNNPYQTARDSSFSGNFGEGAIQFEFNFLPYSTQGRRWNYTPYIAAGVGVAYFSTDSPGNSKPIQPVLLFSIGFKVNIAKNLGLEVEYGFRKTFYDNFDGLTENIEPQHTWLHNNDWYSFAGVAFTWKIFNKLVGCPAYDDVDAPRRR